MNTIQVNKATCHYAALFFFLAGFLLAALPVQVSASEFDEDFEEFEKEEMDEDFETEGQREEDFGDIEFDFKTRKPEKKELEKIPGIGKALRNNKNIIGKVFKTLQVALPIKYEEEKTLGAAIAAQVFSRFGGSYKEKSLLQYVNFVGSAVAIFSDRPNIPYYFAVINNPEPNAFAVPGGYVFLTTGLLRKIKNEAELAGVLAHEIAHISQKHALNALQMSKVFQGMSGLTLSAMDKNPAMFENIINNISSILFERGLDHNSEYEADRIGTEFAYRAGYNPKGLINVLKTLERIEEEGMSIFFKTHPSLFKRINRLRKDTLPLYQGINNYPNLSLRFSMEMKGKF